MYKAPVDDISFTLKHVAGLKPALDSGAFGDLGEDLVDAILAEAGRFASEEVAPLYKIGDEHGAMLKDAAVTMPPGWKALYRSWIDGGWNALSGPEEFGGQGLPTMLGMAALEMWNSAAMAFGIGPTLTMGAVEALDKHSSEALKAKYLAKLVSGEWMGTMNLTEPQAGSDLAALRSRAEPAGDGTYRIFGQKIFITYGEHDFTDNIIHLVLARLPDAPAGTRGISLFLVPKFLVNDAGSLGARNDVFCSGLEHKLGIHASPTCTEAATQKAIAYANERRQGKASDFSGAGMAPIVHHPDVQRNLLTMKALTQIARAISYSCAYAIDFARVSTGEEAAHWRDRANLLTPLAKAFSTDIGVDVASLGVQVHGGMGFIEETGAAALYRDARIAPIYEGTNGIQAIDLVARKLPLGGGEHVHGYIAELKAIADEVRTSNLRGFGRTAEALDQAFDDLTEATRFLQKLLADGRLDEAQAGATPYLRLISLAAGGAYLARGGLAQQSRIALCRFFAENLLGEVSALKERVIDGAESLAAAGKALISA
ncbi:acyl-CoA dehydrogenase [Mesorhizobium sp. L2C054A000]|nr:acyl-CoA dehydrogenase family protein [Mesorhizobium sp. L2C054A000]ESZ51482.1 acyl-CoA dehydrogenase [Mesorhizobium sp. L2C054A000]